MSENELRLLVESGDVVECVVCGEFSAYAWSNTTAYDEFDRVIPGGFRPEPGSVAHVSASSCWEWECGHCGAHHVEADSPILAECYTHAPQDISEEG